MARRNIIFTGDTSKKFATNARRGTEYQATIQNLTDQSITITITNQDIQDATANFDTPSAGALVIAAGAVGSLNEPYDGWLITPAAGATGTVNVYEAG